MKCTDCPCSLVCLAGRLGAPYGVALCPKCKCIYFIVEEHITVDVNMHSHRLPQMPQIEERKNAHIIMFACEKRSIPPHVQEEWERQWARSHHPRNHVLCIEDPGPGDHDLDVQCCMACAGQFDRAGAYWKVLFHQLDAGDEMPKL